MPRVRCAARRVKRTLVGVCSRDWVCVKMFGGVKKGRVEARQRRAVMKRVFSAVFVFCGSGCGGRVEGARRER